MRDPVLVLRFLFTTFFLCPRSPQAKTGCPNGHQNKQIKFDLLVIHLKTKKLKPNQSLTIKEKVSSGHETKLSTDKKIKT